MKPSCCFLVLFFLRPEVVAACSGFHQNHVFRQTHLLVHHPGHQSPRRVHHARPASPARQTQRHEQRFLEAGASLTFINVSCVLFLHVSGVKELYVTELLVRQLLSSPKSQQFNCFYGTLL